MYAHAHNLSVRHHNHKDDLRDIIMLIIRVGIHNLLGDLKLRTGCGSRSVYLNKNFLAISLKNHFESTEK